MKIKDKILKRWGFLLVGFVISVGLDAQVTKSLWVGETYTCDASSAVMGSVTDISWSSSGGYIQVNGSGLYRDVKATQYWSGTASVTCSWRYTLYYGGQQQRGSRTWYFTCTENPVSISPTSMSMVVGEKSYVTYSHKYSNQYSSYADTYFSCSSSCVSVSKSGTVVALQPGTAYINVYSNISNAANAPYCKVTVLEVEPTSAYVDTPISINADASKQLSVSVDPSNATVKNVVWSIAEGSEYISLSSSGLLTGKNPGTAKVYCTVNGDVISNTAIVKVSEPPFTMKSSSPSANATDISAFVHPSVTFSTALYQGGNYSSIVLKNQDNGKIVEGRVSISGSSLTFIPDNPLEAQTNFVLSIPANAVKNKWGTSYTSIVNIPFRTGEWDKLTLSASVESGFIVKGTRMTLAASVPSAKIYYTINGISPTDKSNLYADGIIIDKEMHLRAIAMCDGYMNSDIVKKDYLLSNVDVVRRFPETEGLYTYQDVNPYIKFSNGIDVSTNVDGVKLEKNGEEEIDGDVVVADSTIFIVPKQPLDLGCIYKVSIPADAVKTWQGESNKATSWTFTTGDFATIIALGGPELAAAVKTDGTLLTWGKRYQSGNSADGSYKMTSSLVPSSFVSKSDARMISSGYMHHAIVKNDNSLWMWGRQYCGEFGNNSTTGSANPVKVMADVAFVSAGGQSTAIIKTDGTLWMCGRNDYGQIGDNSVITRKSPVKIMDDIAYADAGWCVTYAIKKDGSLWAWGSNENSLLGNGKVDDSLNPVKIMDDVVSVDASASKGQWVAAIKTDGSLWVWGTEQLTPTKILDDVCSVAVGSDYVEAVQSDGSLWAFGNNSFGQLGDGTTTDASTPKKVMDNVAIVASGGQTTMAHLLDGSVWTWGRNPNGTLGNDTEPSLTAYIVTPNMVVEGRGSAVLEGIATRKRTFRIADGSTNVINALPIPMNAIYSEIKWNSKNDNVASITERGVVSAESIGETDITASIRDYCGHEFVQTYHIIVVPPTGIENIEVDTLSAGEAATEIARYNLNGQLIPAPQRGVNIIRYSDGTIRKVLIR